MSDAVLSRDGERLYYLTSYAKGESLWVHIFRDDETKILTKLDAPGGDLVQDQEGKNLYVLNNGNIIRVDTSSGNEKHMRATARGWN